MVPITVGQEVFVEARMPGGILSQIGFALVVSVSPGEIIINLDAPSSGSMARDSFMPDPGPSTGRAESLEPLQRVRLRMNDDSGSYFADTRVAMVINTSRVVLQQPDRVEVEWQRMFFRLDVRVPFVAHGLGIGNDQELSGITRDLSGGGLRFSSRTGVELGNRFTVTLQLPHAPVDNRLLSRTPTTQGLYSSVSSIRVMEQKSIRPEHPSGEMNLNPCSIEAEGHIVRCRMLWTADQVTHDIGLHFSKIHERTRDRLIGFLLDEQRRRKALGFEETKTRSRIG